MVADDKPLLISYTILALLSIKKPSEICSVLPKSVEALLQKSDQEKGRT
jgi:hypothetical protein